MLTNYKRFIPIFAIIVLVIIYGSYTILKNTVFNKTLVVSGSIEAVEVHLGVTSPGVVDRVLVEEGDRVQTDQLLASVGEVAGGASGNIRSPIDGIVLLRAVEPGEIAPSGGALLVVADLSTVTLTVYVTEVHYGKIHLGDQYQISVDSFPDRTFPATVTTIANEAEFTPRNAQSVQNRKNTVYAVKLTIPNPNLDLKPGMPADVTLTIR